MCNGFQGNCTAHTVAYIELCECIAEKVIPRRDVPLAGEKNSVQIGLKLKMLTSSSPESQSKSCVKKLLWKNHYNQYDKNNIK